jgi:hypothetical protein
MPDRDGRATPVDMIAALATFRRALEDPSHRRLFDLWHGKANPPQLPGRRDFAPFELDFALPNLVLLDVLPEPQGRFRFQLGDFRRRSDRAGARRGSGRDNRRARPRGLRAGRCHDPAGRRRPHPVAAVGRERPRHRYADGLHHRRAAAGRRLRGAPEFQIGNETMDIAASMPARSRRARDALSG